MTNDRGFSAASPDPTTAGPENGRAGVIKARRVGDKVELGGGVLVETAGVLVLGGEAWLTGALGVFGLVVPGVAAGAVVLVFVLAVGPAAGVAGDGRVSVEVSSPATLAVGALPFWQPSGTATRHPMNTNRNTNE